MNGKLDPIWLAEFEQLQHLQERWRGAKLKRKRLSDHFERPLRWRRQLLLMSHLKRELSYIERQLNLVMQYIRDVDSDTGPTEAANEQSLLEYLHRRIDVPLSALEYKLDLYEQYSVQRRVGHDDKGWDSPQAQQNNYENVEHFHRAADAVVLGLFIDIFGESWVKERILSSIDTSHWYPIALFCGGETYMVDPSSLVAKIPESDLLRARLWPSLAHEIGHLKVNALFRGSETHPGYLIFPDMQHHGAQQGLNEQAMGGEAASKPETWSGERRKALERLLPEGFAQNPIKILGITQSFMGLVMRIANEYETILRKYSVEQWEKEFKARQGKDRHTDSKISDDQDVESSETGGGSADELVYWRERCKQIQAQHSEFLPIAGFERQRLEQIAQMHLEEYLADAIAIESTGPAVLWSFLSMGVWEQYFDRNDSSLDAAMKTVLTTHPLSIARVLIMRLILRHRQAFIPDSRLLEIARSYFNRIQRDVGPAWHGVLERSVAFARKLAQDVLLLSSMLSKSKPFDEKDAQNCLRLYSGPEYYDEPVRWSPRVVLNLAWIKRTKVHDVMHKTAEVSKGEASRMILSFGGSPSLGLFPELARKLNEWADQKLRSLSQTTPVTPVPRK